MRTASRDRRLRSLIAATAVACTVLSATAVPVSAGIYVPPWLNIQCLDEGLTPSLSGLSLSGTVLEPSFDPGEHDYYATLPNATGTTLLTASATYAGAELTYSTGGAFMSLTSGVASAPIAIAPGAVEVIEVLAGYTTSDCRAEYLIYLDRRPGETRLSSLTVAPGGLTPAFSSTVTSYTSSIAANVASVLVTPTALAADSTVQMSVGGGAYFGVASGTVSAVAVAQGTTTTIVLRVTAADGVSTRTYSILVTRAAPAELELPDVRGLRLAVARAMLRDAGYTDITVIRVYSRTVPKRHVIRCTEGNRFASAVLRVSKGPRPR